MTRVHLVDPDGEVQQKADEFVQLGSVFQRQGQFEFAFEAHRRAFEVLLENQPEGQRFHKGRELASMAGARIDAGLLREGLRWMLYAFIEDALSRAEDSPAIRDEMHWPAAQWLRRLGLGDSDLMGLSERIRSVAAEMNAPDPSEIFVALGLDDIVQEVRDHPKAAQGPISVFVSSPGDLRKERRLVAEVCREIGSVTGRDVRALLWEGAGPRNPECQPFPPTVTGMGGQGVISEHVRDALGGYDVYLGMAWRRMGTPTGGYRSGTEAEFQLALEDYRDRGRPSTVLFYTKAVRKDSRSRDPGLEDFIKDVQALGLTQTFRGPRDLRRLLVEHLGGLVRTL